MLWFVFFLLAVLYKCVPIRLKRGTLHAVFFNIVPLEKKVKQK